MKLLEERIKKDGVVLDGDVLKVDSFVNHQIDVKLMNEVGKEFRRLFENEKITKILTVEASGIAIACLTAQYFDVPVVFAKKSRSLNTPDSVYSAEVKSYTRGGVNTITVAKKYIESTDRLLIIDDFLARGEALKGLISLAESAGASVAGCGVVIEKAYQNGGDTIRSLGYRVEALARVKSMSPAYGIEFC